MPGRITKTLGNLSVRLKLSLGFGLVLLLTLAITLTGWHGLDTMIERSESLSSTDRLNSLTKDLRAERIIARVENTPQNVTKVVDRLNEIEAHLTLLRKQSDEADTLASLDAQSKLISRMEKTFTDLGVDREARDQTRTQLDHKSEQAVKAVAQVEAEVLKAVSEEQDNGERMDEFTNLSQLKQQIQIARYQVQAYTFSGKEADEVSAIAAIDEALKEMQQISQDQADENIQALVPADQALQQYREQLTRFKAIQIKTEAGQEAMESLGDQMLSAVAELSSLQGTRRDSEAADSRRTLTGVAGLPCWSACWPPGS